MSAGVGASDSDGDDAEQAQDHDHINRVPGLWVRVTTEGYACVTCGETFETSAETEEHTRDQHDPFLPGDDYADRRNRDREWLRRTLVERDGLTITIGNRLGVTPQTVRLWADRHGFEYDRIAGRWRDPAGDSEQTSGTDDQRERKNRAG